MKKNQSGVFLLWPILTGILAALLFLALFPNVLQIPAPRINIQQVSNTATNQKATAQTSYAPAVNKATAAVVSIYTEHQIAPRTKNTSTHSNLGSGVIMSPEGYIMTNHHVVRLADNITVALTDGRKAKAQLIGTDPSTDLALLKINLPKLKNIQLTNSDKAQVGDVVLAIGNPFDIGQTVTMGIVSATDRHNLRINAYENFIQTDAHINPGNSGGALVNAQGNLLGINSITHSLSANIGFAIPANLVKQVMIDLIQYGRVVRGWLGIEGDMISSEVANTFKLEHPNAFLVSGVYADSPADIANIQPGDILISLNNQAINSAREITDKIAEYRPGTNISLQIIRNNQTLDIEVAVTERPRSKK